jgi:uncharacterized protein (TIGR02449 family)
MPHLAIGNLSLKIDDLLQHHAKLATENHVLKKELAQLHAEKAALSSQNQLAVKKIKHVVSQLREEIHERIA